MLDMTDRTLVTQEHLGQVFASQADCCLPGLGGFKDGCSTMRI